MLYFFLPIPIFLGVCLYGWKKNFDLSTLAMIYIAMVLYFLNFYNSNWNTFTVDASLHANYVKFIATNSALPERVTSGLRPVSYYLGAQRHPPTYYVLAAFMYKLAESYQYEEPLQMARFVSMVLYILFIVISVDLIRLILKPGLPSYYCALSLVLFWPIGVTMGSRLTCDILLYTGQIAVIYNLACWFETKSVKSFTFAFLWVAISVLAKNTGIIMMGISIMILIGALYEYRRNLLVFLRFDLIFAILFAELCCHATTNHRWISDYIPQKSLELSRAWEFIGSFNIFYYIFETYNGLGSNQFWTTLLQTLLLGKNMPWQSEVVQILFHCVFLIILIFIAIGAWKSYFYTPSNRSILYLCTLCISVMVFAMIYMFIRTQNIEYFDGRYIYSIVPLIALGYGRSIESFSLNLRIYKSGIFIAIIFPILTCLLFLLNLVSA